MLWHILALIQESFQRFLWLFLGLNFNSFHSSRISTQSNHERNSLGLARKTIDLKFFDFLILVWANSFILWWCSRCTPKRDVVLKKNSREKQIVFQTTIQVRLRRGKLNLESSATWKPACVNARQTKASWCWKTMKMKNTGNKNQALINVSDLRNHI